MNGPLEAFWTALVAQEGSTALIGVLGVVLGLSVAVVCVVGWLEWREERKSALAARRRVEM